MKKVLLVEPGGGYIRLDRCMQSVNSWGGAYRFPLNLARIGSHLMSIGCDVDFIDLQADIKSDLEGKIRAFKPSICILSCGFPSMEIDASTARAIKSVSKEIHVSTFGVAPTLLQETFFESEIWGFDIPFDSIVVGGEPALGYEELAISSTNFHDRIISTSLTRIKSIDTTVARSLFDHKLYRSPFTGHRATYIEGSYGCPHNCNFCVVPTLYNNSFSKRTPEDIVNEFQYVIENDEINQITLWDEGTTFQKKFINELCDGLIELRKSKQEKFRNFIWSTRSTTTLLDEEITEKLYQSGLSGITLGIESFDNSILNYVEKNITAETNYDAIRLLKKFDIISIGHFIIGHLHDTKESIEFTISSAVSSDLNFAQFYCAVPYPGTKLHQTADSLNLIRVKDLTKYELSNPIMDTINGVSYDEIGNYRVQALESFWSSNRWSTLDRLISNRGFRSQIRKENLRKWNSVDPSSTRNYSPSLFQ